MQVAPPELIADLQRELAFYFGAYHDQLKHPLDAAHCRENECERIKKLLYAAAQLDEENRTFKASAVEMVQKKAEEAEIWIPGNTSAAALLRELEKEIDELK